MYVSTVIPSTLGAVKQFVNDESKRVEAVEGIYQDIDKIATLFFAATEKHYATLKSLNAVSALLEIDAIRSTILYIYGIFGDELLGQFPDNDRLKSLAVECWKRGLSSVKDLAVGSVTQGLVTHYAALIRENGEVAYQAPSVGGCYVATAVYGSYDCSEVWLLRRFRDKKLATCAPGRIFITTYYAVSPALVRKLGSRAWLVNRTRRLVDFICKQLKARGWSDAPYLDELV